MKPRIDLSLVSPFVFAHTTAIFAVDPFVIHIFAPFKIHVPSFCSLAIVIMPDGFEPNDSVQAPASLPILAGMQPFDQANNNFKTSEMRTGSLQPTFTTDQDVDVFYLQDSAGRPLSEQAAREAVRLLTDAAG